MGWGLMLKVETWPGGGEEVADIWLWGEGEGKKNYTCFKVVFFSLAKNSV